MCVYDLSVLTCTYIYIESRVKRVSRIREPPFPLFRASERCDCVD